MIAYGPTKLIYGISQASQIGFGLTLGYQIVSSNDTIPYSFSHGCRAPIPVTANILLLPVAAAAFASLMGADKSQMIGLLLSSCVGDYTAFVLSDWGINSDAIPFLAAIAVTLASRLFAYFNFKERPLVYIINGLLVLVPGGVGVRGMSSMWTDAQSGLEFTTRMLLIGVCLAMGVFVALIPSKKWFQVKEVTNALAYQYSHNSRLFYDTHHKKHDGSSSVDQIFMLSKTIGSPLHLHVDSSSEFPAASASTTANDSRYHPVDSSKC